MFVVGKGLLIPYLGKHLLDPAQACRNTPGYGNEVKLSIRESICSTTQYQYLFCTYQLFIMHYGKQMMKYI